MFLSASNPSRNPNFAPAVVRATISGSTVNVSEVLNGIATATDIPTDAPLTLNLQDPDSMIFNRFGDLVLDSQADGELILVHHLGLTDQSVYHLGLTLNGGATQVDDTIFATATHGVILVSDRDAGVAGIIYSISKNIFSPGVAYSAALSSVGSLRSYHQCGHRNGESTRDGLHSAAVRAKSLGAHQLRSFCLRVGRVRGPIFR